MEPTTMESVYQQTETEYRPSMKGLQKIKIKNPLKVPQALLAADRTVSFFCFKLNEKILKNIVYIHFKLHD